MDRFDIHDLDAEELAGKGMEDGIIDDDTYNDLMTEVTYRLM